MCSVGDAFNIDIEEDVGFCEMVCNNCGKQFKGIGKDIKCPKCHSADTSIINK
jgi:Zn finger protein HypA/HybF involved in hydrogenase expression